MEIKTFKKGEIIFRQGDPGDCMYDIFWGNVGVYVNYGTPEEKQLTTLKTDDFFGEMGLLDHAPRSATAVVLQNETQVQIIKEEDFEKFFAERPAKVFVIMQQLCHKLRRRSLDYLEVCKTVYRTVENEKNGAAPDSELSSEIDRICDEYQMADIFDSEKTNDAGGAE